MTDERAIAAYQTLLEAWNQRNADAFAAAFAVNGSAVGFDGSPMNGRDEIAATLRDIFRDHPTASYVARVREVRALGAGVTLLRAVVGMVPPGQTTLNPSTNAIQGVVFVEDEGRPSIALLQNTPAAFHGRPELVEKLTEELGQVVRCGVVVATD